MPNKSKRIVILSQVELRKTLSRLTSEIIEKVKNLDNLVLVGIPTRGIDLAKVLEKELFDKISKYSDEMNKILICSSCSIFLGKSEQILVKKSVNEKCTRCWHKVEELENGICKRCINNMSGEGEARRFF